MIRHTRKSQQKLQYNKNTSTCKSNLSGCKWLQVNAFECCRMQENASEFNCLQENVSKCKLIGVNAIRVNAINADDYEWV